MRQLTIIISAIVIICVGCSSAPSKWVDVKENVKIAPDYSEVTFPRNIAPITFSVACSAEEYYVEFLNGDHIVSAHQSTVNDIRIPEDSWHTMQSNGEPFVIRIYAKVDGAWQRYPDITNRFADTEIDSYLSYRLIAPGYELWDKLGIYQRNVTNYDQTEILTNSATGTGCMNCHSYANHSADKAMLHLRGSIGGTLIKRGDKVEKVSFMSGNMTSEGIYPSWHPSERFIAFSLNEISQYFHIQGRKPIEVSDAKSDLMVYDIDRNEVISDSTVYGERYMETFPEWSSDGRTLYFTRAQAIPTQGKVNIDSICYNLCSIDFDPESRKFSNLRLLYDAASMGKSVSFPKVIPHSGHLVFTLSDYGNFSIWHPEADLHIINLQTLESRALDEINSDDTESYHSFSSNGRWMVVSSRRDDGLYTRPYICGFDPETAKFTKPFLLPQSSAGFYDDLFYSFNIPNFTKDAFSGSREFLEMALSKSNKVTNKID